MPTGSVKLQSIKKLGQENHSYEFSDDGNALFDFIDSEDALLNRNAPHMIKYFILFE